MKQELRTSLFVLFLGLFSANVCASGPATLPPPGTTGNADNVPFIGGRDSKGNPVRLAQKTGHVSNYDESKVPEYSLPDPLKMSDGRRVTTTQQWKARRTEILRFYEEQIYGRISENAPAVTWKVVETDNNSRDGLAITRKIEGTVGEGAATGRVAPKLRVTLHLPKERKGRVPVLLNLSGGIKMGHGPGVSADGDFPADIEIRYSLGRGESGSTPIASSTTCPSMTQRPCRKRGSQPSWRASSIG